MGRVNTHQPWYIQKRCFSTATILSATNKLKGQPTDQTTNKKQRYCSIVYFSLKKGKLSKEHILASYRILFPQEYWKPKVLMLISTIKINKRPDMEIIVFASQHTS